MTDNINSLQELAGTIFGYQNQELPYGMMLGFGDAIIALRSNSSRLVDRLSVYFDGFVLSQPDPTPDMEVSAIEQLPLNIAGNFIEKQPDPGKTKIKEEYIDFHDGRVVRKRQTGMVFFFGRGINIAAGNCVENTNQVVNFINNRYIQLMLNRGFLLGHAAAVDINGTGIAIAGFAGAGKSTFCLHLMAKGASFISNDRLLVKKRNGILKISGVAKLPRVNPGTVLNNPSLKAVIPDAERRVFEKIPTEELWDIEHKYDVFINSVFGGKRFSLYGRMDILLILNWKCSKDPFELFEVDIARRRDLLKAFIKSPGLFYEPDSGVDTEMLLSEASYIDLLSHCRVFEVSGGVDFEKAVGICMQLAEG